MASSTVRPSTSGSHDSHDPPNPLPRLSTSLGGETDPDQGAGPSSPSVQWSRPFPPARNTSNASNRSHRSRHHPPSPPSVPNPAPSSSPSALGHQGDMPPLMPPFRGIRPSDTLGTLATIDAPNGSHGGPYEPAPVPRVPDSQHQKVAEKDGGAHERLPILSDQNWDRYQSPAGAFPTSQNEGWEEAFERQRVKRWKEKVDADLLGWRGGNGPPRSGYSKEAVPTNSYYGQPQSGIIGRHLPKEVVRIERDWSGGEICQFETAFPMELESRISPQQWRDFIAELNPILSSAYSIKGAVVDNLIAIATWWSSILFRSSHFESELKRAERSIRGANETIFNPVGLNVLSPRDVALQFLEVEYY